MHYNGDNSYSFVNKKAIFKFKTDKTYGYFPTLLCLGIISNGFSAIESREVFLRRNAYDILVNYNSIDKSDILNIFNNLMVKNNINK